MLCWWTLNFDKIIGYTVSLSYGKFLLNREAAAPFPQDSEVSVPLLAGCLPYWCHWYVYTLYAPRLQVAKHLIFNWLFLIFSRKAEKITIFPADVILFEGILTLYHKEIRDLLDMKLFVDIDSDTRLSRRGNTITNWTVSVFLWLVLQKHYFITWM